MDSRWPRLVFVLLALYAAIHFSYYYPQLPGVVASHFDAHGRPNGWQTKSAFFSVLITVSVLAAVVGFGVPRIIAALPSALINLPNKRYWLAEERRAESIAFLSAYFAWFGCAFFLVLLVVFDYALQSNLHPESPPDVSRLWYLLVGITVFLIVWTIRLLVRFGRPPREGFPAK